jgi:hypothetical protein
MAPIKQDQMRWRVDLAAFDLVTAHATVSTKFDLV